MQIDSVIESFPNTVQIIEQNSITTPVVVTDKMLNDFKTLIMGDYTANTNICENDKFKILNTKIEDFMGFNSEALIRKIYEQNYRSLWFERCWENILC